MKKEIEVKLKSRTDGTYDLTHFVQLERTDLSHYLTAKLIIELPDEKLRLSKHQVRLAYLKHFGSTGEDSVILTGLLKTLGFSE